jgi:predicted transcriptional regulator
MAGEKQIEFRKIGFRRDVEYLVIYASSPEKRVLGYARVKGIAEDSPEGLWRRFRNIGGIDKEPFFNYFRGKSVAYGILIDESWRLSDPKKPQEIGWTWPIPQSFRYTGMEMIRRMSEGIG